MTINAHLSRLNPRLSILLLTLVFLFNLLFRHHSTLNQSFDFDLIYQYHHSQDIPHEVPDRIFLSDSQIHIAAGYLYTIGKSPHQYNFQHPPFIKYLYGYSSFLFSKPLLPQILFGYILLLTTYSISIFIYKSHSISIIASLLLLMDPLYNQLLDSALLDLGQSAFIALLILYLTIAPHNWLIHGLLIGIIAASKFWTTAIFISLLLLSFHYLKHKSHVTYYLKTITTTILVFILTYTTYLLNHGNLLDLLILQLKTLNYWLHHSLSGLPGNDIILILTGWYQNWWPPHQWLRASPWSLLWPIALVIPMLTAFRNTSKIPKLSKFSKFTKNLYRLPAPNAQLLIFLFPYLYLLYLAPQAPYPRYFIIILPYLYLNLASAIHSTMAQRVTTQT